MSYTAIATILFDAAQAKIVLNAAIQLARHTGAHLKVICAGVDHTETGFYYAGAQAIAVQQNLDVVLEDARKLQFHARAMLDNSGVPYDIDVETIGIGSVADCVSDRLRFFDVAVLALPYQAQSSGLDVVAFEACLFQARCPVFMVPYGDEAALNFDKALIAWDDGAQALAAVRAAAPLLAAPTRATILMVDPAQNTPDRSDPGGRLSEVLARYGAKVEISVLAKTDMAIAHQLLRQTKKENADYIIMGAYKHSRLREAILGGTTRDILKLSDVPVLLAH
jgi:nucleotide-binding universal stress UspA family protein